MIDIYTCIKYQTRNQTLISQTIKLNKREMLEITNVFNEVTDKFADCMRVNTVYTDKCVIEISRPDRKSIYATIYKYYTLAQIHETIQTAIHVVPNNPRSIEMARLDYKDHIPPPSSVTDDEIRDIFVFDADSNSIVSIPYDNDRTLLEFMDANPNQLKPYYSISTMSMVYKIYIIDYTYLRQKPQIARLKKTV